jgi:hypothetical protein
VRGVVRRVGPFSLEGWLVFLFVGVVILGVTTCNARRDGRREAHLEVLRENEHKAVLAGIRSRHQADSAVALSIRQADIVKQQGRRLTKMGRALDSVLAENGAILADSFADVPTLRAQLQRTTEVVRLYRDSADVLLGSVERMLASQSEEREAWMAERERNTILVATKDSVISALRESEQGCRILFARCPSRIQSVGIGAGIVLLLLL